MIRECVGCWRMCGLGERCAGGESGAGKLDGTLKQPLSGLFRFCVWGGGWGKSEGLESRGDRLGEEGGKGMVACAG